jgi:glycosyltransferase involved in cell wall biosynthesis
MPDQKLPAITIAMPVYNCAATVAAAILSIQNQIFTDWELIIIDDGSTDDTWSVANKFSDPRITLIKQDRNLGLPTRLNEAVQLSRGEYFARMDGDDISYPERFALQYEYICKHPEVDLLGCAILIFDAEGQAKGVRQGRLTHEQIRGGFASSFSMAHVTWIGRRDWFVRNPYRASAFHSQDRELLMRTYPHSRFAALPDVLVGVREPGVHLKKLLPARCQYGRFLLLESISQRSPFLLGAVGAEIGKAGLDLVAVASGLNYSLLRHRIPTLPASERERWDAVRKTINVSNATVMTAFAG